MPTMSRIEAAFCGSAPWRIFTRRVVLPWALQRAAPVGDVLEVGAGSGAMAMEVLTAHHHIHMTVTDYDQAMVDAAAERLADFTGRVEVRRADATMLPFASDTFDTVLSFLMLHHTVQWEKALDEAVRVLKPGGELVGYDLLSNWLTRTTHRLDGSPHRLMGHHDLAAVTDQLPLTDNRLKTGFSGMVVRFTGHKALAVG